MSRRVNGYPIGTRRRTAQTIARRNERNARKAWMEQIPREPRELVAALREAGVDLDGLRKAL